MTTIGWIQILLYCAIIVALTPVLGAYMTRVFNGERTFLSPVLRPVEAVLYGIGGVDEKREQINLDRIRILRRDQPRTARDSNHRKVVLPHPERPAYRVLSRPSEPGQGLAHDDRACIARHEIPASQQRDFHGLKKRGIDVIDVNVNHASGDFGL